MERAKYQQVSNNLASSVKSAQVGLFTVEEQFVRILRCTVKEFVSGQGEWQVLDTKQRRRDWLGRLNQTPSRVISQGSEGALSAGSN
jgi:hypothetical protein